MHTPSLQSALPVPEGPSSRGLISARDLSYLLPDGRILFKNLTLQLGAAHYGLVGLNGTGKTTLARVLAGVLEPLHGEVFRTGRIAFLPQERLAEVGRVTDRQAVERDPSAAPLQTTGPAQPWECPANGPPPAPVQVADLLGVREALTALRQLEHAPDDAARSLLLAQIGDRWQLEQEVADALRAVGLRDLDPLRPLATLSGGELTRVRLAACLLESPDFLILDEPTNHLDGEGRAALTEFLELWPGGALVISHDRALLSTLDIILELTPQGLTLFGGSWSEFQTHRQRLREAEQQALQNAEQTLELRRRQAQAAQERQAHRAARGKKAREKGGIPPIALGTMKGWAEQSTSRLKTRHAALIDASSQAWQALKAREVPARDLHMDLLGAPVPSQRRVLCLERVTFAYPGRAAVLKDFSLELQGPERVALVGPNGSGKSTLLKLAQGLLEPCSGRVDRNGSVVATLSQLGEALEPQITVLEQLRRVTEGLDETTRRLTLGRFFFRGERAQTRVSALSGGERLRLGLVCAFAQRPAPQLLLLDEPSNNLDLESLTALEDALRGFRGALLVCSHDLHFLDAVGIDRWVELPPPG